MLLAYMSQWEGVALGRAKPESSRLSLHPNQPVKAGVSVSDFLPSSLLRKQLRFVDRVAQAYAFTPLTPYLPR